MSEMTSTHCPCFDFGAVESVFEPLEPFITVQCKPRIWIVTKSGLTIRASKLSLTLYFLSGFAVSRLFFTL